MDDQRQVDLIQRVTGAAQVFSTSMNDLLDQALAEASNRQLSLSQVKLLLLISRPGMRFKVSDVAEFLGVTNAAASRSIDRLVQRGLLNRTTTPEDRRAVDLTLTPWAQELLQRFSTLRNQHLARRLGRHPADKLARAAELLDELSVLLVDPDAHGDDQCLRCETHFRDDCLMREVAGHECARGHVLFNTAAQAPAPPGVADQP